jgi:hypothetical protein
MAKQEYIEAAFLNVVATPHPTGVYPRLMKLAADRSAERPVSYRGAFRAAITAPSPIADSEGLYSFQLVAWLEVNPDEPTINKAALKKAAFPREGREFAKQYGVNGRVFYCILNEKTHWVTAELKNEDGQNITPRILETIFTKLLSPETLGIDAELVEVTVVPKDDALDFVLGFKRLDKVDILVKRPNDDDITGHANRVLQRLIDEKAKSLETVLTRMPKTDGLELDEDHTTLAQVAAINGHVDSTGLDDHDQHGKRSTRELPKVVRRILQQGTSYFAALRSIARQAGDTSGES